MKQQKKINSKSEVPAAASSPNFHSMAVTQLKKKLRKCSRPVNRWKDVLLEHLCAICALRVTASAHRQTRSNTGFAPFAKWKELKCNEQWVSEPNVQHINILLDPLFQLEKLNPQSTSMARLLIRLLLLQFPVMKDTSRGKAVCDRQGKLVLVCEEVIREGGWANLDWLKQNKLTHDSKPADWINALLPFLKPGYSSFFVSIDEWTSFFHECRLYFLQWRFHSIYSTWDPQFPCLAHTAGFITLTSTLRSFCPHFQNRPWAGCNPAGARLYGATYVKN